MDFTREPIIETIITPKEGYKLVVRSSKGTAQEEYFVDAVEVVSFGHALFFRSMERPKSFLVPVADYEILEVREARMVLKNAGLDRSIKIGGGREGTLKVSSREADKGEAVVAEEEETVVEQEEAHPQPTEAVAEVKSDARLDKKRDRRRHYRKRRGSRGEEREEAPKEEGMPEAAAPSIPPLEDEKINIPPPEEGIEGQGAAPMSSSLLSSLLQPPPTLISETISRYRENALFKNAFFLTEEEQYKPHDKVQELLNEDDEEDFAPPLQEPTFAKESETATDQVTEQPLEAQSETLHEPIQEEVSQGEEAVKAESIVVEEAFLTAVEPAFQIEEIQHEAPSVEKEQAIEEEAKEFQGEQMSLPLFAEEESTVKEPTFVEDVTSKEEESVSEESSQSEEKKEEHPSH